MPPEIQELLEPIPGDAPGGKDHSGHPEFLTLQADVKKQRKEMQDRAINAELAARGEQELPVESGPTWKKIRDQADRLLRNRTKDLESALYWTEAGVETDGFVGLADGLGLLNGILEKFWDGCFPALSSDGDDFRRWSKLLALESLGPILDRQMLLQAKGVDGPIPISYYQWKLSSGRVKRPSGMTPEASKIFDDRVREVETLWEQASKGASLDDLKSRLAVLDRCVSNLDALETTASAKFRPPETEDDVRSFPKLRADVESCRRVIAEIVESRGGSAAGAAPAEAGDSMSNESGGAAGGAAAPRGPVQGRAEAVQRLREIAAYFRATEPHSPISYLLERAIRWADMPFEILMRDIMDNQDALSTIDRLLGIKPPESSG
ncbi:MAG: type VI secretion system protein TssA [Planctomycetes bacterium]|nr:type VI secretion system protein TssA [Planctomycetota bacterium]